MRIFPAPPAIIVETLPIVVGASALEGKDVDRLLLTWEQRRWMRGRFTTEKGREIGVALPTGVQVEPGRIMWIGTDWYLTMGAASESLLAIHAADRQEAIRIAFEVGNLHFPLAAAGDSLLVPDDTAMIQLLGRMGARWKNTKGHSNRWERAARMNRDPFLSVLQFSDGLFPVGSYAHSFGLELYVAEGKIRDASGVEAFLDSYLQGSVAPTDVVAALASRKVSLQERRAAMEQCIAIDRSLDAMKLASELRDASRQMGRQVLRIAANLSEPSTMHRLAADLSHAVENEMTQGHHAMAFGAISGALGWSETEVATAYLYATCAGLVAAALRLIPLGQLAGQQILWALAPSITKLVEEIKGKEMADIWSFAPGIEIAAMRHAMLDARLFRS